MVRVIGSQMHFKMKFLSFFSEATACNCYTIVQLIYQSIKIKLKKCITQNERKYEKIDISLNYDFTPSQ